MRLYNGNFLTVKHMLLTLQMVPHAIFQEGCKWLFCPNWHRKQYPTSGCLQGNIFRRDLFYLLDYVTRRSENWDLQKKKMVQRQIGEKCLSRVHLSITEKTLPC